MKGRAGHLAAVVGAVAAQALADWGADRVALLDDGSVEAELAARFLAASLGAARLERVTGPPPGLEPLLQTDDARVAAELRRFRGRLLPGALLALPANKTALLLGGPLPPEPLLPLGDLYASEVRELAGAWSAPAPVPDLAARAGGIERLDDALRGRFDRRDPRALGALPGGVGREVEAALALGRASRLAIRVVPKLGTRTLGLDLLE